MAFDTSITPQDLELSDGKFKVFISVDDDGRFSVNPLGAEDGFEFIGNDPAKLEDWKRIVALIDRAIDFIQSQYEQTKS